MVLPFFGGTRTQSAAPQDGGALRVSRRHRLRLTRLVPCVHLLLSCDYGASGSLLTESGGVSIFLGWIEVCARQLLECLEVVHEAGAGLIRPLLKLLQHVERERFGA